MGKLLKLEEFHLNNNSKLKMWQNETLLIFVFNTGLNKIDAVIYQMNF